MKTTLFAVGALVLTAAAQPSRHRRHEQHHDKRQVVVTNYDYVTATAPDVVVYVDAEGNPLYTSTVGKAPATAADTATASAASAVTYAAGETTASAASHASAYSAAASVVSVPSSANSPTAYANAAASATTKISSSGSASSAKASSSGSSGSANSYNGVSYSPYSGSYSSGNVGCKTANQVKTDFESIDTKYNLVRIYGTDCNQVSNVLSAASAKGMKVFAGIYNITQLTSELGTIIDAANGNWNNFHTISIGNELVNAGTHSVSEVVAAISSARTILKAAGYTGHIVTVDTQNAIMKNPELCENSDYAAANAHPFFNSDCVAADAGKWLLDTMDAVSSACGGMDTFITETGWPWSGDSNGAAVPSPSDQNAAMDTIAGNVTSNVIMFTAFNDLWKAPGYLNVEQSWGIYGNSASS